MRRASVVLLVLALGGCSLAPQYSRPVAPVPSALPGAEATSQAPFPQDLPWKEYFTDERQRALIELALANSRDYRIATLNIEKARALYRIQRADLFPPVGVLANASTQRIPGKMADDDKAFTSEQYTVALGISSWELDLFGRVRSLKQAALEQYFATDVCARDQFIHPVKCTQQRGFSAA